MGFADGTGTGFQMKLVIYLKPMCPAPGQMNAFKSQDLLQRLTSSLSIMSTMPIRVTGPTTTGSGKDPLARASRSLGLGVATAVADTGGPGGWPASPWARRHPLRICWGHVMRLGGGLLVKGSSFTGLSQGVNWWSIYLLYICFTPRHTCEGT